jgi:dienelactone hydrolase
MAILMKLLLSGAASLIFLVVAPCVAQAPGANSAYGEKIEFESVGLKGVTRKVWSYLSMPNDASKPVAAMVLVHGSGGLSGREARYVREYNQIGIATLVLAPFEVRGVAKTTEDQSLVSQSEMNSDALGALRYLQTEQRIDPKRIGIQGASKGGNVALSLAFADVYLNRRMQTSERFALHIPIYAACSYALRNPKPMSSPILMLHGESDDYADPAKCKRYAQSMKANGANIQFVSYAGAHHGFDGSDGSKLIWLPAVQNSFACMSYQEEDGSITDEREGKRYKNISAYQAEVMQRPCVTRGAHVGVDSKAKAQSLDDIKRFLRQNDFVR